jgi:molybdenum cofactor synthesis domain-containing protein
MSKIITSAILIIGNEILNGSVQDANGYFLAKELANIGIIVKQIRIIADDENEIITNIHQLKDSYDYIFSTGGIGPTHDDITIESVAKAFDLELEMHQETVVALTEYYNAIQAPSGRLKSALKMAYLPKDAKLIYNPISRAPGFIVENIYVMPGVPSIMQAMFDNLKHSLIGGDLIEIRSSEVHLGESLIAKDFALLQKNYLDVEMGSYPFIKENKWCTKLVLRSSNIPALEQAFSDLKSIISNYE